MLELAQLLGQLGVFLTCPSSAAASCELDAAAVLRSGCRRPPSHYSHQIYTKFTPNLLAIPLIFNKVS
jgi:hypothetical protein